MSFLYNEKLNAWRRKHGARIVTATEVLEMKQKLEGPGGRKLAKQIYFQLKETLKKIESREKSRRYEQIQKELHEQVILATAVKDKLLQYLVLKGKITDDSKVKESDLTEAIRVCENIKDPRTIKNRKEFLLQHEQMAQSGPNAWVLRNN